jgi:photosystem II stability/assembly factor-like uncharacterized protein
MGSRAPLSAIVVAAAVLVFIAGAPLARAQWQMQDSHTTASLRGIHAVGNSVAWTTGTDGTILRTQDGGAHWKRCATPAGAEKLDFRGVWAWSPDVAMALSSGPGELSRLYLTNDGCSHWTEETRNTDKGGFWDVIAFKRASGLQARTGIVVGDPVKGRFATFIVVPERGWLADGNSCVARDGEAGFAASNSSGVVFGTGRYIIVTGGKGGPRALLSPLLAYNDSNKDCLGVELPLAGGSESAGAFSVAFRDLKHGVVVGGDYKKPEETTGTAAWTDDGGRHWSAASKPPHGYRSAVAWYVEANVWIAVGTSGSDVSRDDGKTWERLDNGKWNAVSPPFAVGPGGRIGRLHLDALKPAQSVSAEKQR